MWLASPRVYSKNDQPFPNQYLLTDSGTISTHGYNSLHTSAAGQELANQHTTMCIRRNEGYCAGKFKSFLGALGAWNFLKCPFENVFQKILAQK